MSGRSPTLHLSSLRLGNLQNHAQLDCLHKVPHMALRNVRLPAGYHGEGLTAGSVAPLEAGEPRAPAAGVGRGAALGGSGRWPLASGCSDSGTACTLTPRPLPGSAR